MYELEFLIATAVFLVMTVFVFFNYPESWRRNRMFCLVLILWHLSGMISVAFIFTAFREIPFTGVKYSVARIGTFYYLMMMLMTGMFALRLIIRRIYLFLLQKLNRPVTETKQSILMDKRVHAMCFIALSYLITVMGYFNIDILHTTEYDVQIPKTADVKNLNIVFLADVHAGSGNWEFTYSELVKQVNAAKPDVLLLGGDIFDETTSEQDVYLIHWFLENIEPPRYGVYYVYGNHDDARDDWAGQQMRDMGVNVPNDQMVLLGDDIQLICHDDPSYSSLSYEELFASLSIDHTKPVILLTHRPQQLQLLSEKGVDLMMAGHTHGFNIPFFLGIAFSNDMFYGRWDYSTLTAITTSGVAAWGWHYKWPARSEIVSIHAHFQ